MEQEQRKRISFIAIGSVICALAGVGSQILWALLGILGPDLGTLVIYGIYFSYAAGILGIVAIIMITIRRRILKGYIYAALAIILSLPFVTLDCGVRQQVKVRQERIRKWTGLYNLEVLGEGLVRYAKDNEGCLPVAERWCDLLMGHNENLTEENFRHPKWRIFRLKGQCHFAFNKNLSGMRLTDVPDDVVLIFEADGDWNLNGTSELLRTRYEGEHSNIDVLFVDQTVGTYRYNMNAARKFDPRGMRYERLRWKPDN